jgi:hypothetical protein
MAAPSRPALRKIMNTRLKRCLIQFNWRIEKRDLVQAK